MTTTPVCGPARVLVLDDEPSIRTVLGYFLKRHGCCALEAASVEEAQQLADASPIDAFILDVRLPGKRSGIDLLADLRRRPELARTPAIVLTGSQLGEDEQAAVTRHHAHVFYKPEGFPTVIAFLKQLLGRDQPN